MRLVLERPARECTIRFSGTIRQLLASQKLNSQTVLVVKNGVLATLDERVSDADTVKILSVISGG